jgi:hypothetical protein
MIPGRDQIGTADVATWRAVPARCNPLADEQGAWAVIAGDSEEPDLYIEITAENPGQVAEFLAAAVREHACRSRFDAAAGDADSERKHQRSRCAAVSPGNPAAPDALKLACLAELSGNVARELTAGQGGAALAGRDGPLYRRLTKLAAGTLAWMEAILSQDGEPE